MDQWAAGYMAEDTFTLGDELAPAKITFGCGGMYYPDGSNLRQDGMAGFSRGNTAFHTQLAKAGVIDAHVFGFCSEGMETSTAMLTLGRYNFGRRVPELAWTRMLGEDDLAVRTMSWKLGDKTIASSSNVYTVLDSGTTLTLLPSAMHHDFMTHLNETARSAGLSVVVRWNTLLLREPKAIVTDSVHTHAMVPKSYNHVRSGRHSGPTSRELLVCRHCQLACVLCRDNVGERCCTSKW